ncbi:MAG: PIN domain-containing protein [Candidatus Altiarchaeota archaeon]|nr:PIN domain-containing protein [Candidatus Altiarchaeota archaeon]
MAVFVDTGVFVAIHNVRDQYHGVAKELGGKAASGVFGGLYTSDYVLDEVVAFIYKRTDNPDLVLEAIDFIQNSGRIEILHVDGSVFASAKMCVEQYSFLKLSLTDWTSVNLMVGNGIDRILSFDSDFDRLHAVDEFSGISRIHESL